MNNYGFVRVAAATPSLKVADCDYNINEILKLVADAEKSKVSAIAFPELSITGYTCADLFLQRTLLDGAKQSLCRILDVTKEYSTIIIVGMPLEASNKLYNVAVVICGGKILGVVPKTFLPNYNEFYEKRWFSSSDELKDEVVYLCDNYVPIGINLIFETQDFKFSVEICEDLWTPIPPSSIAALNGAEIVFNLSST